MHELSPGPIYGLPNLTGEKDHDPRSNYPRPPAYTISPRFHGGASMVTPGPTDYSVPEKVSRFGKEDGKVIRIRGREEGGHATAYPGPGQYDPQHADLKTHQNPPAFSFGKKTEGPKIEALPGPGDYETATGGKVKAFTMHGRPRSRGKNNSPGPGDYNIDPKVYRKGAEGNKGFTMHGRSESSQGQYIPGPGSYDFVQGYEKTHNRTIAAGFGGKGKEPALKDTPGPGSYDPSWGNGPKGFTMRGREGDRQKSLTPGPGDYTYPDKIYYTGKDGGRTIRINGRPNEYNISNLPGPGWYTPENGIDKTKKGKPAFSFGGKVEPLAKDYVPGPGSYSPMDRHTPIGFNMRGRPKEEAKKNTPGPGDYEVADKMYNKGKMDTPRFTMRGRDKALKQDYVPGPGSYSPESSPRDKNKGPQWSLGDRHNIPYGSDVPGPGSYNPDDGKKVKGFKIHNSKDNSRNIFGNTDTPGPNYYKIDPNIGNKVGKGQPAFSMKGRDGKDFNRNDYPGPGSYTPDLGSETKKDGPMYSFGAKRPASLDANPGPGYYDPDPMIGHTVRSTKPQAPQVSIGLKNREGDVNINRPQNVKFPPIKDNNKVTAA